MVALTTKPSLANSALSHVIGGSSPGGNAALATRLQSQNAQTAKVAASNASEIALRFGTAVTLDLSVTSPNAPQAIQDTLKVVNQIKQQNIDAKVNNPKAEARKKLDLAVKQLALLKILQPGLKSAREAAKIAKTVSDAAKEYAAAERAAAAIDPSDLPTAPTSDAAAGPAGSSQSDISAAQIPPQGADPAQKGADAPGSSAGSSAESGATASPSPLPEDSFFKTANGILGELKKYLRKTLPALLASQDRKIREEAAKIRDAFNKSVNDTADAEQVFNDARPAAIAIGLDTAPTTDPNGPASGDAGGTGTVPDPDPQPTPINLTA